MQSFLLQFRQQHVLSGLLSDALAAMHMIVVCEAPKVQYALVQDVASSGLPSCATKPPDARCLSKACCENVINETHGTSGLELLVNAVPALPFEVQFKLLRWKERLAG
jgi:hypothetical protein